MENNERTASLDYVSEYERAMANLAEAMKENQCLHDELDEKNCELRWLYGFKAAVDTIFRAGEQSELP